MDLFIPLYAQLHFTTRADDFFAKCINGTLTEEDFDFNGLIVHWSDVKSSSCS